MGVNVNLARVSVDLDRHFTPVGDLGKKKETTLEIGILSNGGGYTTPMAIRKLRGTIKAEPKIINYESYTEDSCELSNEGRKGLLYIKKNNLQDNYLSRAEAFIALVKNKKIDAPRALKIINRIQEQVKNYDAFFLPGGEDIPSVWYDDEIAEESGKRLQYRTLVELTIISEAKKRGIPLMGVCRGFQIINVFNGKKLEKNVWGQNGITQTFKLIEKGKKGLLSKLFEENVRAEVYHHQGVSAREGLNGKGDLEPMTQVDGLIKAVESKYSGASPIIGTQFHPEMHTGSMWENSTANNTEFFTILSQGGANRKHKQQIIPEMLVEAQKNLKDHRARKISEKVIKPKPKIKPVPTLKEKIINIVSYFLYDAY